MSAVRVFSLALVVYLVWSANSVSANVGGWPLVSLNFNHWFEPAETLVSTWLLSYVFHMESDLANSSIIMYSDETTLATTDGVTIHHLVGRPLYEGYKEGKGSSAHFDRITGFHQLSPTEVIMADHGNNCLRVLNRQSGETALYLGTWYRPGHRDGKNPLFHGPWSIIQHPQYSHILLVSETGNNDIRSVNIITKTVSTVISNGLNSPRGMRARLNSDQILTTNTEYISVVNLQSNSSEVLAGSTIAGFLDGDASYARFFLPRDVLEVVKDVLVVTDNFQLRIVDLQKSAVTTLCIPNTRVKHGDYQNCERHSPRSLLLLNNTLYVGEMNGITKLKLIYRTN